MLTAKGLLEALARDDEIIEPESKDPDFEEVCKRLNSTGAFETQLDIEGIYRKE